MDFKNSATFQSVIVELVSHANFVAKSLQSFACINAAALASISQNRELFFVWREMTTTTKTRLTFVGYATASAGNYLNSFRISSCVHLFLKSCS